MPPGGSVCKAERVELGGAAASQSVQWYLAHIDEKHCVPCLRVDFAKKKWMAQLNGLQREKRLRGITKGRDYCSIAMVFSLAAAIIDRSLRFFREMQLSSDALFYTEMIDKVLFNHKGGVWAEGEGARLRSEIRKFNGIAEKTFAPLCPSGLLGPKFHSLKHRRNDLKRSGSWLSTSVGPFKHFVKLIEKICRMASQQLWTRMHETVMNMSSAQISMQRPGRAIY